MVVDNYQSFRRIDCSPEDGGSRFLRVECIYATLHGITLHPTSQYFLISWLAKCAFRYA